MGNGWKVRVMEGRVDKLLILWKREFMGCCDI